MRLGAGLGISLAIALAGVTQTTCSRREVVDSFPPRYAGIGVELEIDPSGLPRVRKVHPNGPAQSSGIESGDRILSIDDQPTSGQSFGDIIMKLRGKPNSEIRLTLQRNEVQIILSVRRQVMTRKSTDKNYTGTPASDQQPKSE